MLEHLDPFLAYCRRTRRVGAETLEWYRRHLRPYCAAADAGRVAGGDDLMDWLAALPVSDATRAGYFRAVRALSRWADARGLAPDFTRHLRPRWCIQPRRLPPSSAEFWRIIAGMSTASYQDQRNRVLFSCTFLSCCRVSEIGALRWDQVDRGDMVLRILGKGRKWRVIPCHPTLLALLDGWRAHAPGAHVFPRGAGVDRPLHRTRLTHLWRDVQLSQGIARPWSYHDIRRAGASWLARNGMSLFAIQQLLGHSDIRTTQIYLSIDTATLQAEMRRAWARDQRRSAEAQVQAPARR